MSKVVVVLLKQTWRWLADSKNLELLTKRDEYKHHPCVVWWEKSYSPCIHPEKTCIYFLTLVKNWIGKYRSFDTVPVFCQVLIWSSKFFQHIFPEKKKKHQSKVVKIQPTDPTPVRIYLVPEWQGLGGGEWQGLGGSGNDDWRPPWWVEPRGGH